MTGATDRSGAGAAEGADDTDRLLSFLRDRDVPCPVCRYNLRDLSEPRCPECRQPLSLTVGAPDLRIGLLIATLVPSMFSGIAALLLSVPIILVPASGGAAAPAFIVLTVVFGWLSGLFGLVLVRRRHAFLRRPPEVQWSWVVGTWGVHVGAFLALLSFIV